jgi:hypothetical protein
LSTLAAPSTRCDRSVACTLFSLSSAFTIVHRDLRTELSQLVQGALV